MISEKDILEYLERFEDISSEERKDERKTFTIFKKNDKIMLVIHNDTKPLRIETRCDLKLSKNLQEKYESVMESKALGRNGIEIICSGQLESDEILDLVRHAYEKVSE
ncbi:MAG: MmcQ/YjbR family DNA-binding protein [Candidatus Saccharibacteria bacterium]|jgi:predicted DNA-binding protein (MmcQ/YjbR family)|nr:MmcQ/YjbR family DNA-binding protein [Candidatus Saccharibacteria bacterium]